MRSHVICFIFTTIIVFVVSPSTIIWLYIDTRSRSRCRGSGWRCTGSGSSTRCIAVPATSSANVAGIPAYATKWKAWCRRGTPNPSSGRFWSCWNQSRVSQHTSSAHLPSRCTLSHFKLQWHLLFGFHCILAVVEHVTCLKSSAD